MYPFLSGHTSYSLGQMYRQPYAQYTAPVRFFLQQPPSIYDNRCKSKAEVDFLNMNRLLWMEHVNWTRMVITSIVFNLPDIQFVEERLLRNATDLGNCLRPFYGDQLADRYASLIHDHLTIAAELVTAAVKGDTAKAATKEKEWYKNADDIALFLSSMNPYLNQSEVKKMFYTHLSLTKQEAVSMIQKKYKDDITVFDQIVMEALQMSDMIANGIVKQFYPLFYSPY
ncbi:hypothetical protein [Rummeliibacillus pycnus]|uniref:hypothetical protein n=1 Tax=Rummeliibacillus pycnus TaxID=101070 RepID=UPI000C9CF973|nr:hypothetical protein [Rummeliibacillus pycnus]